MCHGILLRLGSMEGRLGQSTEQERTFSAALQILCLKLLALHTLGGVHRPWAPLASPRPSGNLPSLLAPVLLNPSLEIPLPGHWSPTSHLAVPRWSQGL